MSVIKGKITEYFISLFFIFFILMYHMFVDNKFIEKFGLHVHASPPQKSQSDNLNINLEFNEPI